MKVAVGSLNPVKVRACKDAMEKLFRDVEVIPVDVDSRVSHTPLSTYELITGAKNRVYEALKKTGAEYGVGMEGGISNIEGYNILIGSVYVVDKKGVYGIGFTCGLEIPNNIAEKVFRGEELGDVIDEISGDKNTKQKQGAMGMFTNNHLTREETWKTGIICAMAKFIKPDLYK